MSLFLNIVLSKSAQFVSQRLGTVCRIHTSGVQYLYSQASLGVDSYLHARKKTNEQFSNDTERFKLKMNEFTNDPKSMVFTQDLKNMVHLAEPTDLQLVLNMIKKFNSQNIEFRFGSFVFGPVVMRMFYFLNAPNEALQCFNDPVNDKFFDQQTTYQILLDLLYNNQMYEEMYKVFEKVQEKQLNMTKFPKYSVVLILAACYKQNTPKSLEYASNLWKNMTESGSQPVRRAAGLLAGLALNQGAPHIALEVISQQTQHYVTIRNIKARTLAAMDRVEDALPVLRSVLDVDRPEQYNKHTFFAETIEHVSKAVERSNNEDVKREFAVIHKALEERKLIDNQTLDQLLCSEVTVTKRQPGLIQTTNIQRPRMSVA